MNEKKLASQALANWGNHVAMVAYREASGEAELHEKQVHIPAKTPHQLLLEPGKSFTYFVIKVDTP